MLRIGKLSWFVAVVVAMLLLSGPKPTTAETMSNLGACKERAFSTEEDFITRGPVPPDGNPIISDGDLLSGTTHAVCARNADLLALWQLNQDLGLDAVDILSIDNTLVAFSTELDHPDGLFLSGDLLMTNGVVIPNLALLRLFQVGHDLGLDGLHFVGSETQILAFVRFAAQYEREDWLNTEKVNLQTALKEFRVDIWFSTEGTERKAATVQILDGYVLSARDGIVVLNQKQLFPTSVPAGIPKRGVDFGVDAITTSRGGSRPLSRFSTEILYRGELGFTDGDVLRAVTGAVEIKHADLVNRYEPAADFLGLDALHMLINDVDGQEGDVIIFLPSVHDQEVRQPGGAK